MWAPNQWAPESQGRNSGRRSLPLAGFGWKVCAWFVRWLFSGVLTVLCGHSSTLTAWQKVTQGNSWWAGDRAEAEKPLEAHLGFPKSRAAGVTRPGEPASTCSGFLKGIFPGETSPYNYLGPCLPQISLRGQAALCQLSVQGWEVVGVNPAPNPAQNYPHGESYKAFGNSFFC